MKIAMYDHGLNVELAILLARDKAHSVGYFTPWDEAFPKSAKAIIGKGLEGLHRIDNWPRAARAADVLVFPDTFCGEMVDDWRSQGKAVWGAGSVGEKLEQDRVWCNELQQTVGIPAPKRVAIKGVDKLIEHLKKVKDKWVKLSKFRGDKETFYHESYDATQASFLGQMLVDFGANEELEFIVEDPIVGDGVVEVGDDRLVVNSHFLTPRCIGYEAKDEGYICHVADVECKQLDRVNNNLAPTLAKACTAFSSEVRGGKLIDPCVRFPHPPSAVMLEIYNNLAQAVLNGAKGAYTKLAPAAPYGAALIVGSEWATHHWTEVRIDPKVRHLVKLQRSYRDEAGRYWALPESPTVCTCIGMGTTPQEAAEQACEVVEKVHVSGASYNTSCLAKLIEETVPLGKKTGIPF